GGGAASARRRATGGARWGPRIGSPRSAPAGTTATGTPAIEYAITFTHGRYDSSGSSPGWQPCSGAGAGVTGERTTSKPPTNVRMLERSASQRPSSWKKPSAETAKCFVSSSTNSIWSMWRPPAGARSALTRAPPSAAIILKKTSSASSSGGGTTSSTAAPASSRASEARPTASSDAPLVGQHPSCGVKADRREGDDAAQQ